MAEFVKTKVEGALITHKSSIRKIDSHWYERSFEAFENWSCSVVYIYCPTYRQKKGSCCI